MNPGGSVKDRPALWIVQEAERNNDLIRGEPGIIVEGTAGNTGIGLALTSAVFGYECIIVIARTQTSEKKDCLRQAGAKLIEVDAVPFKDDNHYTKIAERLAVNLTKTSGKRVLYANQWDNLANQRSHSQGTGPEIWQQTQRRINVFNCAMGTGGTLSGVAKYLRSIGTENQNIKICLTDPKGAALYRYYKYGELQSEGSSISEGIGQSRITGQSCQVHNTRFRSNHHHSLHMRNCSPRRSCSRRHSCPRKCRHNTGRRSHTRNCCPGGSCTSRTLFCTRWPC